MPVIDGDDLHKDYEGVHVLRGLDLRVAQGSIHALLGRNGAGKTTTLKVLLGMTRLTRGRARVFGLTANSPASSVEIRRRTGFVSEEKDLADFMTIDEIVRFTAALYPNWQRELEHELLIRFDLRPDSRIRALSRGHRTKLALLLAVCRGADLLMLDEPTSGLDPAMAEEALQLVVRLVAAAGATVLMSSHQISEVEQVADHVTVVDRGRAVLSGELDRLKEDFTRVRLVFDAEAPDHAFRAPGVTRVQRQGRTLSVVSRQGHQEVLEEARSLEPRSVEVVPMTLKEIFLEAVVAND